MAKESRFDVAVDADILGSFLDVLTPLVDECIVEIRDQGLAARAADPATVGMVDAELDAAGFESYAAGELRLGLTIDRLDDVVGVASAGDIVTLTLDPETRKLEIGINGLEYTLALLAPDNVRDAPTIPEVELPVEVVMEGRDLARGITAGAMVADHLTLGTDADTRTLSMTAQGDTDDVHLELGPADVIEGDITESVESTYSLDYLEDLSKPIDDDTTVTLRLGSEVPLKLSFQTADSHGQVLYTLAPRIRSE